MVIEERLRGEIQSYANGWVKIADISTDGDDDKPVNIISALTKKQCCSDGAFEIGGVYAATLSMVVKLPGLTRYQLKGSRVLFQSKYGAEEDWQDMGTFYITDAQKTADIFTLSGQDAMGWMDTSSYNDLNSDMAEGVGKYLADQGIGRTPQSWMREVVRVGCDLVQAQTGIPNIVEWENYDAAKNGNQNYCNDKLWHNDGSGWYESDDPAYFWLYMEDGLYRNDCPRDFLRWLAALAGGFLTVGGNGKMTLRQFNMTQFGTALIDMTDMEYGECEVADYTLWLRAATIFYDDRPTYWTYTTSDMPEHSISIRYELQGNPIAEGFDERINNPHSVTQALWRSFFNYGARNRPRPFRAKTHKQTRFELGQPITIRFQEMDESSARSFNSIITSIEWTFRGGHVLSCGGEDSRVMADAVRATKADKAIREIRSRAKA